MRTPAAMIVGMVLAPCGLVLALTCTFAPDWRVQSSISNQPPDFVEHQGIWDICSEVGSTHVRACNLPREAYFARPEVQAARGLMITSMVVTLLGVVLSSLGVRCWQDEPSYTLAGCGGLVVFASGVLSLVAVSWYNHQLEALPGFTAGSTLAVGYSLVLGYIGSCFEVLGGLSLALSFVHSCGEALRARGKAQPAAKYYSKQAPGGGGAGAPYSREPAGGADYPDYSVRSAERPRGGYSSSDPYRGGYSSSDPYRGDYGSDPRRDYTRNDPRRDYTSDYGSDPRQRDSVSTVPRSYTNPMDVTAGEQPYRGSSKPRSHLSSLPCDSDLL
ncbi:claudin-23 [Lissotriton helveticus]